MQTKLINKITSEQKDRAEEFNQQYVTIQPF